ncbi:MAG: hypothetical protein P8Z37_02145 [Acidobacteriota bacterium]
MVVLRSKSESESGIECYKPNAISDSDTDTDIDTDGAFPTALSGSPNQAFGSAGGSMTKNTLAEQQKLLQFSNHRGVQ